MQQLDHVVIHENEQYASRDLLDLQAVLERYLHDVTGFGSGGIALTSPLTGPAMDAEATTALVGGFFASIEDFTLRIGPGIVTRLVQSNLSDPMQPISGRALTVHAESVQLSFPAPDTDSWYLVTAKPQLTDAAPESRPLWDTDTRKWTDAELIKRRYARAEIAVYGPNATPTLLPTVVDTETVALYAVKRPAGGGALLPEHVMDLRPQPAAATLAGTGEASLQQCAWRVAAGNVLSHLNVHARLDGQELHASGRDLNLLALRGGSSSDQQTPLAHEWWYLYLARPWEFPNTIPRRAQLEAALRAGITTTELELKAQGLLILSKVKPFAAETFDTGGTPRTNSLPIAPRPPFALSIQPGDAICIGQFKRGQGSDFLPAQCDGDHVMFAPGMGARTAAAELAELLLDGGLGATTIRSQAPVGARSLDVLAGYSTSAGAIQTRLRLRNVADTATLRTLWVGNPEWADSILFTDVPILPDNNLLVRTDPTGGGVLAWNVQGYRF